MHDPPSGNHATASAPSTVSVHFVNNVLAAAASYIEVEPDTARDVLAGLGAFLSHRLRDRPTVTLAEELDHVATYLRLEEARFPGRVEPELPPSGGVPAAECAPGAVQAPLADALGRWLREHSGRVHVAVRARLDGSAVDAQLGAADDGGVPGDGGSPAERIRIILTSHAVGGVA